MKKFVAFLLAACSCVACAGVFAGCDEEHTHSLTKVEAAAATCEAAGNSEYYLCACGKYFSDSEAETEIVKDGWVLSATGHTYSNAWSYNETHHWKEATCEHTAEQGEYAEHSLTNGECSCGYRVTTYTVTESEWNDLFVGEALNNVSINMNIEMYQAGATEAVQTQSGFSKAADGSIYQGYYAANGENLTYEEYVTKSDDKWYYLSKSDNAWTGEEIEEKEAVAYTFSGAQGVCFVDKYSAFTYDAENKCYTAENFAADSSSVLDVVKFYVENGKLVKMEFEMTAGTNRRVVSYTFSDYGTTEIDVPTWTVASR